MSENFTELGVGSELVKTLQKYHIMEPTPIQTQTIPVLLSGKDVIGQAQTGTGKTIAFVLPILTAIDTKSPHIQALIMAPTRELALQVTEEVRKLGSAQGIQVLAVYGGQDIEQQIRRLKKGIHVAIGTPGRLLDHLNRGTLKFDQLKMMVLDEADQMLDMGFQKDMEAIIQKTPKTRQTMLFSATMPPEIRTLANRYMSDPVHIRTQSTSITLSEIQQMVIETSDRKKQDALLQLLDEYRPFLAVIFCRTKRRTTALFEALQREGYKCDELHGDVSQARREKVMREFRSAKLQLLVATDVAARGLDVEGITHVFNYDIPKDAESYIHRIGRTGRAGKTGMAVTLVTPYDEGSLVQIEKGIKSHIERRKIIIKINPEHIPNKVTLSPGIPKGARNIDTGYRKGFHHDYGRKRVGAKRKPQRAHADRF